MSAPDRRALAAALRQIRQAMDDGEADEQHSILVTDPQTDIRHIVGPYPNRLTARIAVMLLRARYLEDDPEFSNLTYEVVLTFTPEVLR